MLSQRPIRRVRWKSTLLLLLILILLVPCAAWADQFEVTRVYDGDTLTVASDDNIRFNVRLAGIDAPEICGDRKDLGQPFSDEAKEFLSRAVMGKKVELKSYGHKRYNLMLGVVTLAGKNINLEMIRAGFAEVYKGTNPTGLDLQPLLEAEEEAFQSKRGMWSQGDNYISPLEWRKTAKAKSACAIILYGLCDPKNQ